jgi:hypothetical protein
MLDLTNVRLKKLTYKRIWMFIETWSVRFIVRAGFLMRRLIYETREN